MIIHGDSLDVLKTLPENSVDAVVTDPPYGLSFMGKKWDYDVPSKELWAEVIRVLRPGGHLLSFGGTRTYHRMVCAIEDAGFEIRDQVQWIYGSGFPKSMNVGKQLLEYVGWGTALKPANEPIVLARKPLSESTVAKNVLKHGCGALNIDGSRIAHNEECRMMAPSQANIDNPSEKCMQAGRREATLELKPNGRWPANVLFDESAAQMLDEQSGDCGANGGKSCGFDWTRSGVNMKKEIKADNKGGASRFFYVAKASKRERNAGLEGMPEREAPASARSNPAEGRTSALGAPRANHHPTVKPLKLMEYLCKLITPPGGTILDCFAGSGSTGVAAVGLGFKFIGIEREAEYVTIAEKRIEHAASDKTIEETDEQTCMSI